MPKPITSLDTSADATPTDAELLSAFARSGRKDALMRLLRRYEVQLYGHCLRLMRGNTEAARDLYQESLYKFLEYIHGGRSTGRVNQLLFKIAGQLAVDHYRKNEQARQYAEDLERELRARQAEFYPSGPLPFGNRPDAKEREWVAKGLGELEGLQAEASRRFFLEGATYHEIVAHTGQPLSRVKSALQHGKRKLRAWLLRRYPMDK